MTQANTAQPTTVIFDFGGVLIDWNPRYLYRKLFDDEAAMEAFLGTICTPEWNALQDGGRPKEAAIADRTALFPQHASLIEAYFSRFAEMMQGAHEGTVAVLDELRRRGVPLYGLTNWSADTYPEATARFDFLQWFDGIVVSGQEQMRKPDAAIFRLLLERFDIRPDDAVFIDDTSDNVEAAAALGLHALRFTDPATLRGDLARLGLLDGAGP